MTKEEQQFNQWFDEYADGVKVFEEADMKQAYLQGRAELEAQIEKMKEIGSEMYVLICDKCESRNCAFCSVKEKWQSITFIYGT